MRTAGRIPEERVSSRTWILRHDCVTSQHEKGDFEGGLCRIENDHVIIINKALSNQAKIRVLARELGTLDLESIYIVPALRRIIDENLD